MSTELVAAYSPDWSRQFDAIRKRLEIVLAGDFLRVEHVGSTSVPGMVAKPIIDLIVVIGPAHLPRVTQALETIGYRLKAI